MYCETEISERWGGGGGGGGRETFLSPPPIPPSEISVGGGEGGWEPFLSQNIIAREGVDINFTVSMS